VGGVIHSRSEPTPPRGYGEKETTRGPGAPGTIKPRDTMTPIFHAPLVPWISEKHLSFFTSHTFHVHPLLFLKKTRDPFESTSKARKISGHRCGWDFPGGPSLCITDRRVERGRKTAPPPHLWIASGNPKRGGI